MMVQKKKYIDSRLPDIESLFRSIVENALTGILIIDDAYEIIYGNDKFFKLSGFSRKKRDEAKDEAENKILFNLKELLVPYIDKLSKSSLSETQKVYVETIRSNLNDIASPFISDLYSKYLSLSPTEIQIANFIKNGKTTK